MSRKIIGATVGTTISPSKIADDLNPVKTVNGMVPDDNGNVTINVSDGRTPVKGVDYFTEADVAEVAEQASALATTPVPVDDSRIENDEGLHAKLETIYGDMADSSTKMIYWFGFPSETTHGWFGILSKSSANNGSIVAWSANLQGSAIFKTKFSGSWQPLEWKNPPMVANTEYRTTERINGKAVYKMADSAGNIVYRLDGESAWLSYVDLIGGNKLIDVTEEIQYEGSVYSSSYGDGSQKGTNATSTAVKSAYLRTSFIAVKEGDVIVYQNLESAINFALIALYDYADEITTSTAVCNSTPVVGTVTGAYHSGTLTIEKDGYIKISTTKDSFTKKTVSVAVKRRKEGSTLALRKKLNILSIGSSFCQDCFAYLPPVLNEILPDYSITYGNAYKDSTALLDQVTTTIPNRTPYDRFNYWDSSATKWDRQTGKTFEDIMALKKWDIIYLQPDGMLRVGTKEDGSHLDANGNYKPSETAVYDSVIKPGRWLLRKLQELNGGPFSLMMGQRLGADKNSAEVIGVGMEFAKKKLGIADYAPVGAAFLNARTNESLKELGEHTRADDGYTYGMLYDNHMQAGIPALLAAYTVALTILKCIGEQHRSIYGSTFVPTLERCISIGVCKDGGDNQEGYNLSPPFTHGAPHGVDNENIKAIQEIAVLTVKDPTVKIDFSGTNKHTDVFNYEYQTTQ